MCRAQDDPTCPGGRRCFGALTREKRSAQRARRLLSEPRKSRTDEFVLKPTDELVREASKAGPRIGLELCEPDMPLEVRIAMASREMKLTEAQLDKLSKDDSVQVRRVLARRKEWMPLDAIRRLAKDKDKQTSSVAKKRDDAPPKRFRIEKARREAAMREGWNYPSFIPRGEDARYGESVGEKEGLALIKEIQDTNGLWKSAELAYGLSANKSAAIRREVPLIPNTPVAVLHKLVRDPDAYVRAAAAGSLNLNRRLLSGLAKDPNAVVRAAVATRAGDDLLMRLANDKSPLTRREVAARLRPRVEVSKKFFTDKSPNVRTAVAALWARGSQDEFTVHELVSRVDRGDREVVRAIANNRDFHLMSERSLAEIAHSVDQGTWIPAQESIALRDRIESDPAQKDRQVNWLAMREQRLRDLWPMHFDEELRDYAKASAEAAQQRSDKAKAASQAYRDRMFDAAELKKSRQRKRRKKKV